MAGWVRSRSFAVTADGGGVWVPMRDWADVRAGVRQHVWVRCVSRVLSNGDGSAVGVDLGVGALDLWDEDAAGLA